MKKPLWKHRAELVDKLRLISEKPTLESPNDVEHLCETCGGVVITVAVGDDGRPQILLSPGSQVCGHPVFTGADFSEPPDPSPQLSVRRAQQATPFCKPKVTIICGGCGLQLLSFERDFHDPGTEATDFMGSRGKLSGNSPPYTQGTRKRKTSTKFQGFFRMPYPAQEIEPECDCA